MMSFQIKLVVIPCWLFAPYSLSFHLRAVILISQTHISRKDSCIASFMLQGGCGIWWLIAFQVVLLSFAFLSQFKVDVKKMTYLISWCCGCLSVAKLCLTLCDPWTVAHQGYPLSIGFPRQEYWSGLPVPSLGDLLKPGIKSMSPALTGRFFTTEPPGKLFDKRC